MMNALFKRYLPLFLTVGIVVLLDQWTKWLVRSNIPLNGSWLPDSLSWLSPYARLTFIYNTGAAFGLLQNGSVLFTLVALLVAGAVLYFYRQIAEDDKILRLAAGLYLAGALGNLVDRLTVGQVTDFISVGKFYIFNVADASINVGVFLLALGYWLSERKKTNAPVDEALSTDGSTI